MKYSVQFFAWLLVVTMLLAGIAMFGAVAASADNHDDNETEAEIEEEEGEHIDQHTQLISKEYDSDRGKVELRIHSDILQEITLTDSGAFIEGGEINQRTVTLTPGDSRTITFDVTETRGFVGVSLATPEVLYAVVVQDDEPVDNPMSRTTPTTGWLGGVSIVMGMTSYAAWRELKKEPDSPEELV